MYRKKLEFHQHPVSRKRLPLKRKTTLLKTLQGGRAKPGRRFQQDPHGFLFSPGNQSKDQRPHRLHGNRILHPGADPKAKEFSGLGLPFDPSPGWARRETLGVEMDQNLEAGRERRPDFGICKRLGFHHKPSGDMASRKELEGKAIAQGYSQAEGLCFGPHPDLAESERSLAEDEGADAFEAKAKEKGIFFATEPEAEGFSALAFLLYGDIDSDLGPMASGKGGLQLSSMRKGLRGLVRTQEFDFLAGAGSFQAVEVEGAGRESEGGDGIAT